MLHRQATVVCGLTGDTTVTPMLMDKLVWGEIKLQGCFTADNDATESGAPAHRRDEVPGARNGEPCLSIEGHGEVHSRRRRRDTRNVPDQGIDQSGAGIKQMECWTMGVLEYWVWYITPLLHQPKHSIDQV